MHDLEWEAEQLERQRELLLQQLYALRDDLESKFRRWTSGSAFDRLEQAVWGLLDILEGIVWRMVQDPSPLPPELWHNTVLRVFRD